MSWRDLAIIKQLGSGIFAFSCLLLFSLSLNIFFAEMNSQPDITAWFPVDVRKNSPIREISKTEARAPASVIQNEIAKPKTMDVPKLKTIAAQVLALDCLRPSEEHLRSKKAKRQTGPKKEGLIPDGISTDPESEIISVSTNARRVRLTTYFCDGTLPEVDDSTITNTTNAFEATLFSKVVNTSAKGRKKVADKFSTDYIPLDVGTNLVTYELKTVLGNTIKGTLNIEHRPM
jgi:hypothetical protein